MAITNRKGSQKTYQIRKKNKTTVQNLLNITLCGRMDSEKPAKFGLENAYWLNEPLENGDIIHWHIFGNEVKIHNHNVINVNQKFPIRCVCEIEN